MFELRDIVVFVGLPQAVKEIVKGSSTKSVIGRKTAEDGIQGGCFKQAAPFCNGRYLRVIDRR